MLLEIDFFECLWEILVFWSCIVGDCFCVIVGDNFEGECLFNECVIFVEFLLLFLVVWYGILVSVWVFERKLLNVVSFVDVCDEY